MSDEERNKMIVTDVVKAIEENRSPVVLTEKRSHLECLAEELSTKIRNVIVLRGGMGKKQRSRLLEKMANIPDDEERVIMSTGKYLGEGFDDARLDTLFLTLPVSWRGIIAQYAGRLHRLYDMKKEVIIYDYADDSIPMLARMHQRRRRGYRAIGYTIDEELSNV
jgi:superfamily II DNA or RNA helicase